MGAGTFATVGLGLVTVGVGIGIGILGGTTITGISRQPELAQKLQTVMFITIAIIEGIALFSAVICFMALNK